MFSHRLKFKCTPTIASKTFPRPSGMTKSIYFCRTKQELEKNKHYQLYALLRTKVYGTNGKCERNATSNILDNAIVLAWPCTIVQQEENKQSCTFKVSYESRYLSRQKVGLYLYLTPNLCIFHQLPSELHHECLTSFNSRGIHS